MKWCVLLWEGKYLIGVFGPFDSKDEARAAIDQEADTRGEVMQLYRPEEMEE